MHPRGQRPHPPKLALLRAGRARRPAPDPSTGELGAVPDLQTSARQRAITSPLGRVVQSFAVATGPLTQGQWVPRCNVHRCQLVRKKNASENVSWVGMTLSGYTGLTNMIIKVGSTCFFLLIFFLMQLPGKIFSLSSLEDIIHHSQKEGGREGESRTLIGCLPYTSGPVTSWLQDDAPPTEPQQPGLSCRKIPNHVCGWHQCSALCF